MGANCAPPVPYAARLCVFIRHPANNKWLCGRVSDLQSGGCRFESRPELLRNKVYLAFHPSGVGK